MMMNDSHNKNLAVKSVFNGEIRRFSLEQPSFAELEKSLRRAYPAVRNNLHVQFQDNDGDVCSISSDGELREAFSVISKMGQTVLKLTVGGLRSRKTAPSFSPSTAPVPARARKEAKQQVRLQQLGLQQTQAAPSASSAPSAPTLPVDEKSGAASDSVASTPTPTPAAKIDGTRSRQAPNPTSTASRAPPGTPCPLSFMKGLFACDSSTNACRIDRRWCRGLKVIAGVLLALFLSLVFRLPCPILLILLGGMGCLPTLSSGTILTLVFCFALRLPCLLTLFLLFLVQKYQAAASALRGPCGGQMVKTRFGRFSRRPRGFFFPHLLVWQQLAESGYFSEGGMGATDIDPTHAATASCSQCSAALEPESLYYKCAKCGRDGVDASLCSLCEVKHPVDHPVLKPTVPAAERVLCNGCAKEVHQAPVRWECAICVEYNLCTDCEHMGHKDQRHRTNHPLFKDQEPEGQSCRWRDPPIFCLGRRSE